MAEQPIQHNDIIQIDKTLEGIERIIKQLKKLQQTMRDTAKEVIGFQQKQDPSTKGGKEGTKQATTQTQKLVKENEKLARSIKDVTNEQTRLKKAQKDLRTEQRRQIQIMDASKGSLDRNRVALQKLTERYSRAGPAAARKMENHISSLTNKIKAQETAIGRHQRNVGNYTSAMGGATKAIKQFGAGMLGVTAAISSVTRLIRAAKTASEEFESSFVTVLTLLDKAQIKQFGGMLERGADEIIKKFGLEAADVNKALFDAISAGVEAGESIEFLDKAARLAVGGNAQLSDVVLGMTKIMNAYNLEAGDALKISEALFAAQKVGQTTVGELSSEIGKATSIAAQAGIGYDELLSTIAVLTKLLNNTEETTTAVNATINALINPSREATAAFKSVGIETGIAALRANGLFETMVQITSATEDDIDVLTELIPNIRALKGVGALTAEALLEYDSTLKLVNDDQGAAVLLTDALNMQMDTHAKTMDVRSQKVKSQLRQEKGLNIIGRTLFNLGMRRVEILETETPLIEDQNKANELNAEIQKRLAEIEAKRQANISKAKSEQDRAKVAEVKAMQETIDLFIKRSIAESMPVKAKRDAQAEYEAMLARDVELLEESINKEIELLDKRTEAERDAAEEERIIQDEKERGKQTVITESENLLFALTDLRMAKLEQEKAREIELAAGNKEKIIAIEKEYAKKQQKLAISQALIDSSLAILKTLRSVIFPFNVVAAALIAAQAGMQVAAIRSQTFAEGGHGELGGKSHSQGGTFIPGIGEAEKGEYFGIINQQMTRKYNQDLPAIFDSLNAGKFYDVWSNANIQLQQNIDPYTKLMYELMQNQANIYSDSNGNTVKEYLTGHKRIIKNG